MRHAKVTGVAAVCAGLLIAAGCSSGKPSNADLTSAIDNYYSANPECVFPSPVQLPANVQDSDQQQMGQYNALAAAGLLNKVEAPKPEKPGKHPARHGKRQAQEPAAPQTTSFDVSDNGRFAWTADQTQPGFGNFCYGRRHVTSIDSSAMTKKNGTATTVASYHYDLAGVPSWAKSSEVQSAFPQVQAALSGPQTDKASFVKEPTGWKMVPPNAPQAGTDNNNPGNNPPGSSSY